MLTVPKCTHCTYLTNIRMYSNSAFLVATCRSTYTTALGWEKDSMFKYWSILYYYNIHANIVTDA